MIKPFFLTIFAVAQIAAGDETFDSLLAKAQQVAREGEVKEAIRLSTQAIEMNPANPQGWFYRAVWHERSGLLEQAISDYNKVLAVEPNSALVLQRRGLTRFRLGLLELALRDFDRFLELQPAQAPHHWQRGIVLYYLGKYLQGKAQFELHQSVNPDDVENAVWHFLCLARLQSPEQARERLIPTRGDSRVPMMEIYDLFRGGGSKDSVLKAVEQGNPSKEDLQDRLFYAHFYLGLYEEALGNAKTSLEHIEKAVREYPATHYMGDVARIHFKLRKAQAASADSK
jgi:lipoprotein NlpI